MRKSLSLSVAVSILISSGPGVVPAAARVLARSAASAGAAPMAMALPAALSPLGQGRGLSISAPALASTLTMIEAPRLPMAPAMAPLSGNVPAIPSLLKKTPVGKAGPVPGVRPPVSAKRSLEAVAAAIAPAERKKGGAAAARELSGRFFDSSALNRADDGDGVSSENTPAPRRTEGLSSSKGKGGFVKRAAVPLISIAGVGVGVALAADPALPARVGAWIMQLPGVETVFHLLTLLPGWTQTGIWVAGGFGVAAIAPKIVRPVVKAVFRQLEWNQLREDWLTNVITYASWFGAATYAMGMLGGWQALAVNSSVFALTTTFAVKDVAANVADGFFLYQNRTLRIGEPIEALGVKGILHGANPRFVIIDTSKDAEFGFDRVLIPNEKLGEAALGGVAKEDDPDGRRFGAGAAISLAAIGSVWTALGPVGQSIAIAASAIWIGRLLNRWVTSQEAAAEAYRRTDLKKFKKYHLRSRLLWWLRNSVYISGLGLVMHLFGVPVTGMITGLSIFSAAAGFYMKSVSQNLVGGLMIAAYLPFSAGDFIEVGKYKGIVAGMTQSELRLWTEDEWKDGARGYIDIPLTYVMKEVIKIRTQTGE